MPALGRACRYPVIEKRDPGILHAHRLAGSLQSINSFKARPIFHKPGVAIAGRIAFDNAPGISTVSGPAPGNFFGVAMAST